MALSARGLARLSAWHCGADMAARPAGGGGILIATIGFSFWLPLIVQGMGFSNTETGLVTALLYLLPVPAMILWARSSDRRNDRIWHLASAALFAASALALASAVQSSLLLLLARGGA